MNGAPSSGLRASQWQRGRRLGRKRFQRRTLNRFNHFSVLLLRHGQLSAPATRWTRKRMGSRRGHRDRFAATASPALGHESILQMKPVPMPSLELSLDVFFAIRLSVSPRFLRWRHRKCGTYCTAQHAGRQGEAGASLYLVISLLLVHRFFPFTWRS